MTTGPIVATPRERILRAAHDLFYREGVRATGIDRVIAESGVAKLTFYRQFASKDELVLAFLDVRHERWMAWFVAALARHGGTPAAIAPTLSEWFASDDFRGCAFLNSVGELAPALAAVLDVTRRHKQEMTAAVTRLMKPAPGRARAARALALAIDGAIVQAQYLATPAPAVEALSLLVKTLEKALA
ncbi:TetR/AcrR family transcriptional regulator [Scleromatobacter humisilvae]|uniref:TetR/AcrR family transcriptional regulator n=1 Tax=Scleromatobacter humisilvae TaxID=2897159 RepID=A0A9X1YMT1_9BURK|nr:TetR/AcrR family transcriptional regulator [Scleromatobacter humisilvae]MCK9688677.1 TetR/AcrR family transcriptional regulator [Scleromatobacter humisilvae]